MTGDPSFRQAFFLVGPTASGKSRLARIVAEANGWEILSADSMLVYRGMNIGTAKPSGEDRSRVVHHGMDLTTPDRLFSVWAYRQAALRALDEARSRGKAVLVVGGSGLYVKSLTHGLRAGPGPDAGLRRRLTALAAAGGVEELRERLRRVDPARYAELRDPENPRRLVRALERAEAGPGPPEAEWARAAGSAPLAGLRVEPAELSRRIEARVESMYREGLVDEVRRLLEEYPRLSQTAARAIGYAEAADLIAGHCTREEAIRATARRTRQLAKRQRTWFRRQAIVRWVEVRAGADPTAVAARLTAHWKEHGPTRIAEG